MSMDVNTGPNRMNRRDWLKLGTAGVAGLSGASILALASRSGAASALAESGIQEVRHSADGTLQLRSSVFRKLGPEPRELSASGGRRATANE